MILPGSQVKYFEYDKDGLTSQFRKKDLILCCFAVNDVEAFKNLQAEFISPVQYNYPLFLK